VSNFDYWPPHIFEFYSVLARRDEYRQHALAMLRILPMLVDSLDTEVYKPYSSMMTVGFMLHKSRRMIEIYAENAIQYRVGLYHVSPPRLIQQRSVTIEHVLPTIYTLTAHQGD
jgi:hypothetical protein